MKYKFNDKIKYKELKIFFQKLDSVQEDNFWPREIFHYQKKTKTKDKKTIRQSIYCTLRKRGKIIGIARLIMDQYYCYIIELAILPKYRNRGLGSQLMNKILHYTHRNNFIKVFLFALPGKENFYAKFGFKNTMSQAMEIRPWQKS